MAKKNKENKHFILDTFKDYSDKQMSNLNKSIEETSDTSKSFLGPMLVIVLTIVALFSAYWAVSRVSAKPLKTKLVEISTYVEHNLPSWQSIRMLGYQQEGEQITTGYYYNTYFSTVDVDSLIENGINLGEWAEENKGKLFGKIIIGFSNNSYVYEITDANNLYESNYVTTLRVNGESIACVQFYGLTYSVSDVKLYNPYAEYGIVYIPANFISNPDNYALSNVPVYTTTGEVVSPTYTEDNSFASVIDSVFSGFKLIGNVAITGFSFVEFLLGLIWVIFT